MVFNWFRRQFSNDSDDSQVEQQETPQVPPETEAAATSESTQESSQQAPDDLLNWAKAAYKNIQQQQAEVAEDPAEPTPESMEESPVEVAELTPLASDTAEVPTTAEQTQIETSTAEEVIPVAETVTPAEVAEPAPPETPETLAEAPIVEEFPPAETVSAEAEVEQTPPEPFAVETPSAEAEVEQTPPEPFAVETPSAEEQTPSPVPFWARETGQERLERLRATAIEIPEPVAAPAQTAQPAAATQETVQEFSELPFDEGFLWSAEVLAAQGRRPEDVSIEEITWLKQLRQGLDKTRRGLINQLKAIVGQGPLNQDAVTEIEALLLQADVGVEATDYIIQALQQRLRSEVLPPEQAIAYLKQILRDLLDKPCRESYSPMFTPEKDTLNIWLLTGVNGVGKTTTIGKISHLAQKSGYKCLIAAADTFRAAAVEQVKIWGERSGVEVIANPAKNADPAAVVFDAITAAQARGIELLLVDTAGRLQNKKNLMDELSKIRKIVDKKAANAKIESLLVLDATLGQNGLRQAQVFSEAAKLSGVVLTKLDGTAKGGVAIAVVQQMGLPIRFIGAGEGLEDLRPFSSYEFVEALLSG